MIFPNVILESEVITRPIYNVDDLGELHETMSQGMQEEIKIPQNVLDSFMIKDRLNPEIWNGDKLNPEIHAKLTKIAQDFFETLELPKDIPLLDILMVGSLANYNWSKYSDIDLHLVVDFDKFKESQPFIKKFFDAQKNLFNIKHDIKIQGYDVELYVQDLKEKLAAAAVYSVKDNKWIRKPHKVSFKLDVPLVKRKVDALFDKLTTLKKYYDDQKYSKAITVAQQLKDSIKKMRQGGLEKGGEYSTENIAFKILRRTEFMDLLDIYKNKAYDKQVTV